MSSQQLLQDVRHCTEPLLRQPEGMGGLGSVHLSAVCLATGLIGVQAQRQAERVPAGPVDESVRCRMSGICEGALACQPGSGEALGCVTNSAERQARVKDAMLWSWQGYRCSPLPAASCSLEQDLSEALRLGSTACLLAQRREAFIHIGMCLARQEDPVGSHVVVTGLAVERLPCASPLRWPW